ncbi:MAG: polymer-forming cytoskeletal protein [Gemmatimonadota bacterium]|nr:polymer-forming cytoskeletal protein [Gemmatimonadota bacterium]
MKRLALAAALAAAPAAGLIAGLPAPASAQDVRLAEEPRSEAQEALARFLEAGGFTLWTRDTVLARGDTVPGAVLLLEGTARIAGRIEGDLHVVDGDLFLRSGASIAGDVLVLAGGFYDSDLAEVGGAVTYRPNEPLRVRPTRGGYEIISEVDPEPAIAGFHFPTYDRMNGLSIAVGALARGSAVPGRPELAGGVTWFPAREDVDYRLRNSWRLGERVRLGLYAATAVVSNEEWIRPTWYNSLAQFVAGNDVRNFYDSREFGVQLEWLSPEPPVWEDAPRWRLAVSAGWEDAESLRRRDVTVLFEGDRRRSGRGPWFERTPWIFIDEGSLWFARGAFEWSVQDRAGFVAFGLGLEAGFEDAFDRVEILGPGGGRADLFDFLLVEGRIAVRRVTAAGHAVDAFAIGRADLAGKLPLQRYSTLGGVGTLPTVALRGLNPRRMVYAEATYAVPVLGDAALGGLDLFARTSGAVVAFPRYEEVSGTDLHATVQAGLALRMWDFKLEFGLAAGSTIEPGDPGLIGFIDVRTRKSHRPTRMPARR